nr:hypothetical protein CFP56_62822 [Quercus suber]
MPSTSRDLGGTVSLPVAEEEREPNGMKQGTLLTTTNEGSWQPLPTTDDFGLGNCSAFAGTFIHEANLITNASFSEVKASSDSNIELQ